MDANPIKSRFAPVPAFSPPRRSGTFPILLPSHSAHHSGPVHENVAEFGSPGPPPASNVYPNFPQGAHQDAAQAGTTEYPARPPNPRASMYGTALPPQMPMYHPNTAQQMYPGQPPFGPNAIPYGMPMYMTPPLGPRIDPRHAVVEPRRHTRSGRKRTETSRNRRSKSPSPESSSPDSSSDSFVEYFRPRRYDTWEDDGDFASSTVYSFTPSRGGSRSTSRKGTGTTTSGEEDFDDGGTEEVAVTGDQNIPVSSHVFESRYTGDGFFGGHHTAELAVVIGTTVRYQPLFRWMYVPCSRHS